MAKGPKPPKIPPTPSQSDPLVADDNPKCWQFVPDEQDDIVSKLKVSDPVWGSHAGSRILVNSNSGFVGYVPHNEAKEIIDYIRDAKKRLVGQVLSNSDSYLLVELCAV